MSTKVEKRTILQQCYDARRELPVALGAWVAHGANLLSTQEFAARLVVAGRISQGRSPEWVSAARLSFTVALGQPLK